MRRAPILFACLALCAVGPPAAAGVPWSTMPTDVPSGKPRILLIHDMEGLAGQDDPYSFYYRHDAYPGAQVLLTDDVNAVVDGLLAGGAASVTVVDGHGSGNPAPDLLLDRLDPRAHVLARPVPFEPFSIAEAQRQAGHDREFDAVALVGFHAKSGSRGFAAHTYTIGAQIFLDGHSVTEPELGALLYGLAGMPVIYVSGDDRLQEDLKTMPWVEYTVTKKATSASTAELYPLEEVRDAMRRQASRAVKDIARARVMRAAMPLEVSIRAVPPASIAWLENMPDVDYADETLTFVADDIVDAHRKMKPVLAALNVSLTETWLHAFRSQPDAGKYDAQGIIELFRRWLEAESGRPEGRGETTAPEVRLHYGSE